MTSANRPSMTGAGYDYPARLCTLPIGSRFMVYMSAPAWGIIDEQWIGTILYVGAGSVEVWWDHEKHPNRCQPDLDVWLVEEEELSPEMIDQLLGEISTMTEAAQTALNPNAKALIARWQFQLKSLLDALEGDDKAKASVVMVRIEKCITEANQMKIALPDPPEALSTYTPLTEAFAAAKAAAEEQAQKKATSEKKLVDRAVAMEKHKNESATTKSTSQSKPKGEKKLRPCLDGCGAMVGGNFAMGHDAKLKSLLLKIERGEQSIDLIPEPCLDLVKIIKGESIQDRDGEGNPKGEPKQTYRITAAPVKFPGRDDITLTKRDD